MKRVLFINGYIYLPGEGAIKRTFYLFQMMMQQGFDVNFLTSDFNHYNKQTRDVHAFRSNYSCFKNVVFLHMMPYSKNISFRRYISGVMFENRAVKWFRENAKKYDVVYVTVPQPQITKRIRKICDMNSVKMVIDINDLWPDSLRLFLKNKALYNTLTCFMKINARIGYSNADAIIAVSNEYLNIAVHYNKRTDKCLAVYIGSILDKFDAGVRDYLSLIEKPENEYWITYVGTLGSSYDIETVIDAVGVLNNKGFNNIKMKILGQGPLEDMLKVQAAQLGNNTIEFVGFLEYGRMAAYLKKSDLCVNCIHSNASQSIINKVADYFASGHPVLNGGSCMEMQSLISDYDTGLNYTAENTVSLVNCIEKLYSNQELSKELGRNARKLAEEKFDRKKTHQSIIELIKSL